ncbi:hypothetical protein DOU50_04610, partial [Enterobacter sp. C6]
RPRPLGASLRLAPALRKRFGDLQPDQGMAASNCFTLKNLIAFGKNFLGSPQSERCDLMSCRCGFYYPSK